MAEPDDRAKQTKRYLKQRKTHGLPPIGGPIIARGKKVETQRGGAPLDKRQAYRQQINPLVGDRVNPTAPQKRIVRIKGAPPGSPNVKKFGLPDTWQLKRTVRNIPTVDNIYYGPCGKEGGPQNKPRLRSLTDVYKCLYTTDMRYKTGKNKGKIVKYCKGGEREDHGKGPCDALKGVVPARQALTQRGLVQVGENLDELDQLIAAGADAPLPDNIGDIIKQLEDNLVLYPRNTRTEAKQILRTLKDWQAERDYWQEPPQPEEQAEPVPEPEDFLGPALEMLNRDPIVQEQALEQLDEIEQRIEEAPVEQFGGVDPNAVQQSWEQIAGAAEDQWFNPELYRDALEYAQFGPIYQEVFGEFGEFEV